MANKFIVVTKDHYIGELRFGMVTLHSELKRNFESVYGGGTYLIDDKKKTIELSDKSTDFGIPIFDGWETLKISKDFEGYKVTYTYPRGYYSLGGREICYHDGGETVDITSKLTYDDDL